MKDIDNPSKDDEETSLSKMMVKDNEFEIEDLDPDEDKMTDFTNYSRNRGKLCSKKS